MQAGSTHEASLHNPCSSYKKAGMLLPRLWNRYIETRNPQIHKEYKKLHDEVRKQTRFVEQKEQCEVAKQCKSNPKKF